MIGELLDESAESEDENNILERIKLLVQENFPEGWSNWRVLRKTKEDIIGDNIGPQLINKLRFALPTVEVARAFYPDIEFLSEKSFRDMKVKLLEWEFTRAFILSPPAVANRIRGSAAQTELFNQAVAPIKPLLITRLEANQILSGETDSVQRKRRSSTSSISSHRSKKSKYEVLEDRMNDMFNILLEKIETVKNDKPRNDSPYSSCDSDKENEYDFPPVSPSSNHSSHTWEAPQLDTLDDSEHKGDQRMLDSDFEFLPEVREAEPLIPEPCPQIKLEGIQCQRFGTESWNRIRYKEVEKRLQVSPVFSALKTNTELANFRSSSSSFFNKKEDGTLGTITHGLLLQRKALSEGLKNLAKNIPQAAGEIRTLLSNESPFKVISDNILQYVCAHRAAAIECRRKSFKTKSVSLNSMLQQIPPSSTHLFDEKSLTSFIKENGGINQIFPSGSGRVTGRRERGRYSTQKPSVQVQKSGSKHPTWKTRLPATTRAKAIRATFDQNSAGQQPSNDQRTKSRKGIDKRHQRRK